MPGPLPVALAATAFVGSHLALSHPLRAPLARRLGENGFSILYSLVAAATLGLTVWAFRAAPPGPLLWPPTDALWAVSTLLTLLASVLLLGSVVRNPAMARPAPGAATPAPVHPHGVFAVTRHPMMWSFAFWALAHALAYPAPRNLALSAAIAILALVGAAGQDRRKLAADPVRWRAWCARTSFLPFAAIAAGRARLRSPGLHALLGGTILWLAATWSHLPLAGWPAGIWRWLRP